MMALLDIAGLRVGFGAVEALRGVSLALAPGGRLGVVGESGSGKSTLALAVLGLLPPSARLSGQVRFRGAPLPWRDDAAMSRIRGSAIGFVHQDPISAFSPVHSIGTHLIRAHRAARPGSSRRDSRAAALRLLDEVKIPRARERLDHFPGDYSGGMLQRVMIAAALMGDPALLIADEPTTALDATTQASVLATIAAIVADRDMALLLITHDLDVVAEACEEVAVMYGGRLIQHVAAAELPERAHPYTSALLQARPGFGMRGRRLPTIDDVLPPGWDRDA